MPLLPRGLPRDRVAIEPGDVGGSPLLEQFAFDFRVGIRFPARI
jgi:hypothetical protein